LAVSGAGTADLGRAVNRAARASKGWQALRASGKVGLAGSAGLLALGFFSGYLARSGDVPAQPGAPVAQLAEFDLAPTLDLTPTVESPRSDADPHAPADAALGVAARAASPALESTAMPAIRTVRSKPRGLAAPALAAPAPAAPSPNDELVLLLRAERAVRAGNAALALALTDELERLHPRSSLIEERRAIELMAYCEAGASDASARAARFLDAHPSSVYVGRIIEECPVEIGARALPASDKTRLNGH
jgi:hypothetical protein